MTGSLATLNNVEIDCDEDEIADDNTVSRYPVPAEKYSHDDPSDIPISSGWQSEIAINTTRPCDTSMAKYSMTASDYQNVRETLLYFARSNQEIVEKTRTLSRLTELNEMCRNEPDDQPLNAKSVLACLFFLSDNIDLRYPDITASPDGTVVCRWKKDRHRNLTIEFLPDWKLHFVIFAPSSDGTIRISGRDSMTAFRERIKPYKTETWTLQNAR